MDHALLPSIHDAKLPATYERAKIALSDCSSIDECKDWADKMAALASYAKQADDDSMRKMAERIQARAIRRAGELLKQIEKQNKSGINQYSEPSMGAHTRLSRKQAAEEAGMSKNQKDNALRVATIPEDTFNALVDSEKPPTVTKLAEMGTQKRGKPIIDLKGRCPKEFNKALHFVADVEEYATESREFDVEALTKILVDSERERLRKAIAEIDAIHDLIMTRI